MLLKSGMVLGLFSVVFTLSSFSGNSGSERFIVVVDPGHGGDHPGALGIEKTINMQIANKLATLGEGGEIEVVLTHKNDMSLSLNDRVDLMENQKADLFLSLHCSTSKDQESNGVVAYYYPKGNLSKLSHTYGKILVSHYLKEIAERGEIRTANFFVLENSKTPALLLELGYLSNPQEGKQLKDHKFQQKIAENLYKGLLEIEAEN